jgi:glutathione S-transferase
MILAYGNIPYEYNVVSFEQWPALKADKSKCPFGQVPAMTLPSGVTIAQSGAIARYAAKLAGLYPADPEVAAKADMIQELTMEMNPINPILNWFPKDSDSYISMYQTYFAAFDERMTSVQSILGSEKFFGGNEVPSHGDFCLFHVLDNTLTVKKEALDAFPTMQTWMSNMSSIPQLQKYLSERPGDVGREGSFLQLAAAK